MSGSVGMEKQYLGDGVYVREEGGDVVLTTENGISETNTIILEPSVLQSLDEWLRRRGQEVTA